MTAFTVWAFDDPQAAERTFSSFRQAQDDGLVTIVDHAVVSWPEGADKPDTDIGRDDRVRGGAWGGFLGALIGLLFLVPVLGAVAGAAIGVAAKATDGTGLTKKDIAAIKDQVKPGTSALFLVTENTDLDRLGERFHGKNWKLISTNLTPEEQKVLHETFGG
jgi:uncharacterized membrane protein